VRIDMLERLADLIRDRVFWRPRFPEEPRPNGSVDGGGFTIVPDMMSLVGCSGEEFEAILRSLDFRMQKRKVKRPVVATTAPMAEPQAPGPDAVAEAAVADVSAPAETPVAGLVEAALEPVLAPETQSETPQEAVAAPESTAEPVSDSPSSAEFGPVVASETAVPEAATEEIEIDVWWPKDTGPFRRERPRQDARPQHRPKRRDRPERKPAEAEGGRPPTKDTRPQRPQRPERKPEKPIDPDSPFAVLGALKAQLANKKT